MMKHKLKRIFLFLLLAKPAFFKVSWTTETKKPRLPMQRDCDARKQYILVTGKKWIVLHV